VADVAGFDVAVVVRTAPELARTIAKNPYPAASGAQLHVVFFADEPVGDVLGALDVVEPAERESLRDPLIEVLAQLERLGLLAHVDLAKLTAPSLAFEGIVVHAEAVGPGVATVVLDGGTLRVRAGLSSLLGPRGAPATSSAPASAEPSVVRIPPGAVRITTVARDGRWYVSLFYTLAEVSRRNNGQPVPDFGHGIRAEGGASPSAGATDLLRALAAFDPKRVVELTDPEEMRVLHDYGPLFLPRLEAGAAAAKLSGVRAEVTELLIGETPQPDGRARVTVKRMTVAVATREGQGELRYDGTCLRGTGVMARFLTPGLCAGTGAPSAAFTLSMVERDGEWFVAPARTLLDALSAQLATLSQADLDNLTGFGLVGLLLALPGGGTANVPTVPTTVPVPPGPAPTDPVPSTTRS
ncbi:MAG: hypothetical protein QOD83_5007, partial [Solirubrobacteraceae bacterium]|nr:hypothetical protein [Solirubrobacteraceae bacterium]